jgi:glycosyltransferase involved in cell wall biosynthesis
MRILLVTEDLPAPILAGAGRHAVLLGNALIESGHQVEMLGRLRAAGVDTNHDFLGPLHARIDLSGTGWKEHKLGMFLPMRRLHVAQRIWCAIKSLRREWDVIHYHGHLPMLGALVPAKINFIHTLHDQGAECITKTRFRNGAPCTELDPAACAGCAAISPNPIQTAMSAYTVRQYRNLAAKAFTRHQAICVSDFIEKRLREVLADHHGLRTSVVHNFIDPSGISRATANPRVTISKTSLEPTVTVFMAGRIDSTKGFGALLAAIPAPRLAEMQVRIAGDGPDFAKLRDHYSPLGVEFLGWENHDRVVEEARAADVCVVPSICEEACATTVLEALFLGKPVLALKRGGTPELCRYERFSGQLQLFDDIASLAQALLSSLFANPQNVKLGRGDLAAVHYRLPEILDIYRNGIEHINAIGRDE